MEVGESSQENKINNEQIINRCSSIYHESQLSGKAR